MSEPREFFILMSDEHDETSAPLGVCREVYQLISLQGSSEIHVVEYSALESAQAEKREIQDSLKKHYSKLFDDHQAVHAAEIGRLKKIIAKELSENDELGCEYTYVNALREQLRSAILKVEELFRRDIESTKIHYQSFGKEYLAKPIIDNIIAEFAEFKKGME